MLAAASRTALLRLYSSESSSSSSAGGEVRHVRIYTKTGDKGRSSLFTGERRPKSDAVFEALGNSDELNSLLGLAREFVSSPATHPLIDGQLQRVQSTLLDIGSHLATPAVVKSTTDATAAAKPQKKRRSLPAFDVGRVNELEQWIDAYEAELPVLRNFILPSGGKCASTLHVARAVCRRLERSMQPLVDDAESHALEPLVFAYVNRLSDFLFVCARYAAMREGNKETVYSSRGAAGAGGGGEFTK